MRSFLLALGFVASALAQSISSPAAGDSWPVDQTRTISWDTTGLTGPLDLHLVPAGAKDVTVIVTEIALQIDNTGSYQWSPPETLSVTNVEIIIVDAKQVIVISEVFIIVIIEETTTKTTSTPTKTSTKFSTITELATSSIKISTTTVKSVLLSTTSKSLTLAAIQSPTSTFKLLTTSTTKPLTTIATSSVKLSTAALVTTSRALNSTLLKSTATAAVSAAKATFTGDASHVRISNAYSMVSGGLVALLAMIFL